MTDLNNENPQPASPEFPTPQKQLSPLAKWAFRFFILGCCCLIAGIVLVSTPMFAIVAVFSRIAGMCLWLAAVLFGITAIFQIGLKKKQFKGIPRSLLSFLTPLVVCGILSYFIISFFSHYFCSVNIEGLGMALRVYCNDYGRLPTSSRWCDLLIERADVGVGQFVCNNSDTIKGESSYAMNKYVADMNMAQLPKDVVVLFETDSGKAAKRGWWKLRQMRKHSDEYYSVTESNDIPKLTRGDKLDKLRWNQVGGSEILSIAHHRGKGCNVLFGDGDPKFVETKDIPELRWKP